MTGRHQDVLIEDATEIEQQTGSPPEYRVCDLSRQSDIEKLIGSVGHAEILANNCGGPPPGPVSGVSDNDWLTQFAAILRELLPLHLSVVPWRPDSNFVWRKSAVVGQALTAVIQEAYV